MKHGMAALVALACTASAAAAPFPNGDPKTGQKLAAEKNCDGCHIRKFGGAADKIYTRPDRRASTPQKLAAQVSACNTNLNAGWFPEEEEHVAAFLNQQYYKFK
jgi:hypothetical protein